MALQFIIIQQDSLIAVDNTAISPLSMTGLATNIGQVSFQKEAGKLQYNDRPPTPVEFTDPAPYQTYINTWMTAAAALVPPLQLAQAKQVKKDLVEAIYHHKRRLPYLGNEASDEALIAYVGGGANSTDGSLAGLAAQINANIVTVNNASAATVNGWSGTNATNWANIIRGSGDGHLYTTGYVPVNPGSGGFQNMAAVAGGGGASAIGNGIITRRNALYTDKTNKQTAINALSTIPAVVAYDATTGWSS